MGTVFLFLYISKSNLSSQSSAHVCVLVQVYEYSGFVCKVHVHLCLRLLKRLTELQHSRYMYACVYTAVTSLCFSTSLPPFSTPIFPLSPPPHLSLSPPHHWQFGSPVREPSVWTGQRVYCASRPSDAHTDAHKHLNHTGHLTLGSRSLSGIHW